MARNTNPLDGFVALHGIGAAVVELVRESGLLKPRKRVKRAKKDAEDDAEEEKAPAPRKAKAKKAKRPVKKAPPVDADEEEEEEE